MFCKHKELLFTNQATPRTLLDSVIIFVHGTQTKTISYFIGRSLLCEKAEIYVINYFVYVGNFINKCIVCTQHSTAQSGIYYERGFLMAKSSRKICENFYLYAM